MEPQSQITYMYQEPGFLRLGEGWEKTGILQNIRHPAAYDGFDREDDIESFVETALVVTEDDLDERYTEQEHMRWYTCGRCEEERNRLLEQGDEEAAGAIDPEYTVTITENRRDVAFGGDAEKRVERTFEAYCERHEKDGEVFRYTDSWLEE